MSLQSKNPNSNMHFIPPEEFMQEIVKSERNSGEFYLYYLRNDKAIGKVFDEYGYFWESWMYEIIKSVYVPGTDMVDIGAHIGTQAICMIAVAQELCPNECTVHAFEPIYYPLTLLNTQYYDPRLICVYPFGVGDRNELISTKVHAWTEVNRNFGATALDGDLCDPRDRSFYEGSYGPVQIPIVTLDYSRFESGRMNRRVSVVKIDVEGMELKVLSGMMRVIREDKPCIIMEIWESRMESFLSSEEGVFLLSLYDMHRVSCATVSSNSDYVFTLRKVTKE